MTFTPQNPKQTLFEVKMLSNMNLNFSNNTSLEEALSKTLSHKLCKSPISSLLMAPCMESLFRPWESRGNCLRNPAGYQSCLKLQLTPSILVKARESKQSLTLQSREPTRTSCRTPALQTDKVSRGW